MKFQYILAAFLFLSINNAFSQEGEKKSESKKQGKKEHKTQDSKQYINEKISVSEESQPTKSDSKKKKSTRKSALDEK